jgi:hypothetical protein
MRKILIVLLSTLISGLALNVQAANITFNPGRVIFQVAPGELSTKSVIVNGFSGQPYSILFRVNSKSEGGNLPLGWLSPVSLRLDSNTGGRSASMLNYTVRIPDNTKPGRYIGIIQPDVLQSSEPVSSNGLVVIIEVTGPQSACAGPPAFTNVTIGPQDIWAPSDRDVKVVVSGDVSVNTGCEVAARYSIEDNDGMISGDLSLDGNGHFVQELTIIVSRSGKDKEGKTYNGTLSAEDEAGNTGTLDFFVTVLHDKGKKIGPNK